MNVECAEWLLNPHSSPDLKPQVDFPSASPARPKPSLRPDDPFFLCFSPSPETSGHLALLLSSASFYDHSGLCPPLGPTWTLLMASKPQPRLQSSCPAIPVPCSWQNFWQLRSCPALLKRLPPPLSSSSAVPTYPDPWPPGSLLSWPITAVAWLQPSSFTSSPSTRLHVGHTGLGPIHLLGDLWKPLTPDFGFRIAVISRLFGANGRRWSRHDITGRSIASRTQAALGSNPDCSS